MYKICTDLTSAQILPQRSSVSAHNPTAGGSPPHGQRSMTSPQDTLSNELISIILAHLDGFDLYSLLLSCRWFHFFIRGNKLLHKEVFLAHYDDPSHIREPDWERELQQNVKLERILRNDAVGKKRQHVGFVTERVRDLMDTADVDPDKSLNVALLRDAFEESSNNQNVFLCSSGLFEQAGTDAQHAVETPEDRQSSAKAHCLWGRPIDCMPSDPPRFSPFRGIRLPREFLMGDHDDDSPAMNTRQRQPNDVPVHMVARGKVYDLSEYTLSSLWGPFMEDGSHRTDWEKLEAIMCVLGYNLNKFTIRSQGRFPYIWSIPWVGATPQSFVSPPPPEISDARLASFDELMAELHGGESSRLIKQPDPALEALDPYGVTGTWMRVVCFLDYNDLYHFNFHHEHGPNEHLEDGTLRRRAIDTEEGIITLDERVSTLRLEDMC